MRRNSEGFIRSSNVRYVLGHGPLPTQTEVEIPVLRAIADRGGEAIPKDIYDDIARNFPQLTPEDLSARMCRTHGITEQTYYRWKAKYGGMELSEMQRLKQVEDENRRLKQIVAEQRGTGKPRYQAFRWITL